MQENLEKFLSFLFDYYTASVMAQNISYQIE